MFQDEDEGRQETVVVVGEDRSNDHWYGGATSIDQGYSSQSIIDAIMGTGNGGVGSGNTGSSSSFFQDKIDDLMENLPDSVDVTDNGDGTLTFVFNEAGFFDTNGNNTRDNGEMSTPGLGDDFPITVGDGTMQHYTLATFTGYLG